MKTKQNKWDVIDVAKLKKNDTQEINKAYEILKPFFMWYLKGNEEHFHDCFIKMQTRLYSYDQSKPFHSWLYKLLKNFRTDQSNKKEKIKLCNPENIILFDYGLSLSANFESSTLDEIKYQNDYRVFVNELLEQSEIDFFTEHKEQRYKLLASLGQTDLSFVTNYAKDMIDKTPNNRKRYERICKRLQKLDK